MTRHLDVDRIIEDWLADLPNSLPDRVVEGLVDDLDRTPQWRRFGLPRRNDMNRFVMAAGAVAAIALVAVIGIGLTSGGGGLFGPGATPAPTPSPEPTAELTPVPTLEPTAAPAQPTPSATAIGVQVLEERALEPGTYRLALTIACEADRPAECPAEATPAPTMDIEFTVPAGWHGLPQFVSVSPDKAREPDAPNNSAVTFGWTNAWAGLYSDPCRMEEPGVPDVPAGPTVDEFVDAVMAHPDLDVTEPIDVELGDHSGQFFTLTGPADSDRCEYWLPWVPGFHVQGPNNIWDVWAIDVNGFNVAIISSTFLETPDDVRAELRAIAESVRFVP